MTEKRKVQVTKNYRLFTRNAENRPLEPKKRRRLEASMKKYGFLPCFPIVASRDPVTKELIVKDGQHRLAFAEALGLPVYWIEETIAFDVADVNSAQKGWTLRDYVQRYAANGRKAYQDGLEFAELHGLPIGTAFSLLGGTTTFANVQTSFMDGTFKIKDRAWADAVAGTYVPIVALAPALKNARFIEACMGVCRVPGFDPQRMLHNAERCREKLVPYSTKDAYLAMLDEIYNFGRQKRVALKFEAIESMRQRNAVTAKKSKKDAKQVHEQAA